MLFIKKEFLSSIKLFIIVLSVFVCVSDKCLAQSEPSKSYQIMAGFILHFTSFVEWPKKSSPSVIICIVGDDPFERYIDDMLISRPTNRSGKVIAINRLQIGQSLNSCNLVFATKESATKKFWESIPEKHSFLLVSDYSEFTRQSGTISFYKENKRIRLEINLNEAAKANLNISSDLLKLARITQ